MPEVRTVKPFLDAHEKRVRNLGNEFYCDEKRAEQLAKDGFVEIIGVPAEEQIEEPKPRKKTAKKKVE